MKIIKTYIITELGKGVLDKEIDRLSLLLKDARSVMGGNDDEFQNGE